MRTFRCKLMFIIAGGAAFASAQLSAPTAFDDFSGCAHHTCTWVPWSTHKTFREGDLSYSVEVTEKDDDQGDFVLRRGEKLLIRTPLKDLSASVSVVWSDDRHNFAVTWSDGGAIGAFSVRVFHVEADSVSELPAWEKAWAEFKKRHWCRARGDNIQAYSWLPDSNQLILVLSVYPTGDCGADLGHTEAYVVNAKTGEIGQNWSVKKLNSYMRLHPE
jgi:hypothetical protein